MNQHASDTICKTELIVILGILTALAPLSIDMYLPALTALEQIFATDAGHVQLTLAAFFVAFALGQLVYGPLADRYGRKPVLYIGLCLYTLTSLGCSLADSIDHLIGLRFLQAFGASAGVVVARAVVSDRYAAREAAGIYSAMMLVMGAAPMLAPMLGGYLMLLLGWDAIFEVLAAFGVVALLLVWRRMPETHGANTKLPLTLRSVTLRYASLLENRRFLGYTFASGLAMSGMFAYIASAPFIFIDYFGMRPEHFSWLFGINALGFIATAQLNARLLRYTTPLQIIAVSMPVQLAVSLLLLLQAWLGGEFYGVVIPLFFQIALLGLLVPNMTALGMAHFTTNAGVASAFMGSIQFLIAGVVSMGVSLLHSDHPVSLAAAIAGCTAAAFVIFIRFCRRHGTD
jgi:MFS transporter, DHA1 family, multidrug resistance protein